MATIKAGTYRFNDVLTLPSAVIVQYVDFTTIFQASGQTFLMTCVGMVVDTENGVVQYAVVASEPDGALNETPEVFSVAGLGDGFDTGTFGNDVQTITISTDQEVSDEFVEWFSANAVEQKQISGVRKFKDVLTIPDDYLNQKIAFTCSVIYEGELLDVQFCQIDIAEYNDNDHRMTYGVNMGSYVTEYYACWLESGTWEDIFGEGIKTIDFGTEPQTVSAEFYNWLTANAIRTDAITTGYRFLDLQGLQTFLTQLKNILGYKAKLDNSMVLRTQYLLEVDYDSDLAFNTTFIVGESAAPYVGQAVVGSTYVA